MYPPAFSYHAPGRLDEAADLLAELGPDAQPLAGGQTLIRAMKLRHVRPRHLVDLRYLDLAGITQHKDQYTDGHADGVRTLRVGATTTLTACEDAAPIQDLWPLLTDALHVTADPLVRNLATMGGAAADADPRGDIGPVLVAAEANLHLAGSGTARLLSAESFFTGPSSTALGLGEILTHIDFPLHPGSGGCYLKVNRKVGDPALLGIAVQLRVVHDQAVTRCRIAVTNAGPTYVRAYKAEECLYGQPVTAAAARRAADIAAQEVHPHPDRDAPAPYKQALIRALTHRAALTAAERASGSDGRAVEPVRA
ncbi:MAG: xanthine dehydrogenase family protein subunit M [Streptosporangiales bacterium]|nr:xanthine dehydrogenase family protein subunit M [Streptosporangiales bacterium]